MVVMSNLQAVEELVHRPLAEHGIPLDTTTTRRRSGRTILPQHIHDRRRELD